MNFKIGNCKISINILFFAFIAILFMFDQTAMMGLSLLAAILHEVGHILAMKAMKCPAHSILLRPGAVVINTAKIQKTYKQDIFISFAGPLVNFIAAFFCAIFLNYATSDFLTSFMWINIALGTFNLLPTKGLDGGRILQSILLQKMSARRANIAINILTFIIISGILSAGIYIFLSDFQNPTLLIVGAYLAILTLLKLKEY